MAYEDGPAVLEEFPLSHSRLCEYYEHAVDLQVVI